MIGIENIARFSEVISVFGTSRVCGTSPLVWRRSRVAARCSSLVPRPPRAGGFTYIGLLLFIAIMGAALAGTGVVFHQLAKREKEKELLFIGDQFRRAIGAYYEHSPGGEKRFPKELEDMLLDARYPATQRYLRRIYRDPLTGTTEWGLVRSGDGTITGVYSLAEGETSKRAHFPAAYKGFEATTHYVEWKFEYEPPAQPEPGKAPVNAALPPGNSLATQTYTAVQPPPPQPGKSAQP